MDTAALLVADVGRTAVRVVALGVRDALAAAAELGATLEAGGTTLVIRGVLAAAAITAVDGAIQAVVAVACTAALAAAVLAAFLSVRTAGELAFPGHAARGRAGVVAGAVAGIVALHRVLATADRIANLAGFALARIGHVGAAAGGAKVGGARDSVVAVGGNAAGATASAALATQKRPLAERLRLAATFVADVPAASVPVVTLGVTATLGAALTHATDRARFALAAHAARVLASLAGARIAVVAVARGLTGGADATTIDRRAILDRVAARVVGRVDAGASLTSVVRADDRIVTIVLAATLATLAVAAFLASAAACSDLTLAVHTAQVDGARIAVVAIERVAARNTSVCCAAPRRATQAPRITPLSGRARRSSASRTAARPRRTSARARGRELRTSAGLRREPRKEDQRDQTSDSHPSFHRTDRTTNSSVSIAQGGNGPQGATLAYMRAWEGRRV